MTSEIKQRAKTLRLTQAISLGIADEMRSDSSVLVWGEDVTIGVMGPTRGLVDQFGRDRVRDTPISEAAMVGAAIGAALGGLRPIVDIMFSSFMYVAFDQLVNQAARLRYMTGGQASLPLVVIGAAGASGSNAAQHSEAPYPMLMNAGGLRVVFPSTVHQAYWLTREAIRSDDPVVLLHHPALAANRGAIGAEKIELDEVEVGPSGSDVSVVATGLMAHRARLVAQRLSTEGISLEVVDACCLSPLPWRTIEASIVKTGRLVVVDEARITCSLASEIAASAAERCFKHLKAPILRVAVPDVPIPYAPHLEAEVVPSEDRITSAVMDVLHA